MKLLHTSNINYQRLCKQECNISYRGFVLFITFDNDTLKTSTVLKIERKDNLLEVFTKNSTYTFSVN